MEAILTFILNELGSTVFIPIIIIIIGLCVKMKLRDAISSGLMLGVAFVAMSMATSYLTSTMGPVVSEFARNTGTNLDVVDVGWSAISATTWSWPYVFLVFPLCFLVNAIMLVIKQTNCLNVDIWNYWNIALQALLCTAISGNLVIGLACGLFVFVLELKNADVSYQHTKKITGVPGVSIPHATMLCAILMYPIDLILRKIPFLNKDVNADTLKEKLGPLAENHVLGFIIGFIITLVAGLGVPVALQTGVKLGAMLYVLPTLAKLFMQALEPIAEKASETMKKRFSDREFTIGLDWPILGGRSELWTSWILATPICLLMAVVLPGNRVMPIAGLSGKASLAALTLTGASLIRMTILGIIWQVFVFYFGTLMAPIITEAAATFGSYELIPGQLITYLSVEVPELRIILMKVADIVNGNLIGILFLAIYLGAAWFYFRGMKKESAEIAAELENQ